MCGFLSFPPSSRVSTHVGLPAGPSRAFKDGAGCEESQLLSIQNLHFSLLCLNIHMDISAKLGEEGEGHRWRRKKKDEIWVNSKHRYHFQCETIKNDTAFENRCLQGKRAEGEQHEKML